MNEKEGCVIAESTIHRLDLSDRSIAEEIWMLQHAAYRQEAALIGFAELPPLLDTVASLQRCEESFYGYFLADGSLTGVVSATESAEGMTICRMMVDPDCFRQGIATALLRHMTDCAFLEYAWTVTAEVRNIPAIRLYESCGFRQAELITPAPGVTMASMTKPASAPRPDREPRPAARSAPRP